MAAHWFILTTQPRSEFKAAHELGRDSFQVFFPKVKTVHPRAGHQEIPMFPGYVFLRCDPESDGWPSFRPAHRIANWVSFGGEVPWLTDEIVEDLKERSESINQEGGLWYRYKAGERVQVASGSLEGIAEVIEAAKSPHASVQVLLKFMGGMVRAKIPWENLRPIQEQLPIGHPVASPRPPRRTRGKGRWNNQFRASTLLEANPA